MSMYGLSKARGSRIDINNNSNDNNNSNGSDNDDDNNDNNDNNDDDNNDDNNDNDDNMLDGGGVEHVGGSELSSGNAAK